MYVDEYIKTSEIPTEIVEHLRIVREFLRNEFGNTPCAVSIDGIVQAVIYI